MEYRALPEKWSIVGRGARGILAPGATRAPCAIPITETHAKHKKTDIGIYIGQSAKLMSRKKRLLLE